jgi:ankyrin repeat protein
MNHLNDSRTFRYTPLIVSVARCDADTVTLLLKLGADVNIGDGLGVTPLMHAGKSNSDKMVKLLLDTKVGGSQQYKFFSLGMKFRGRLLTSWFAPRGELGPQG